MPSTTARGRSCFLEDLRAQRARLSRLLWELVLVLLEEELRSGDESWAIEEFEEEDSFERAPA